MAEPRPSWPRDLLVSLSFANLCLLIPWRELQGFLDQNLLYYRKSSPEPTVFYALLANLIIIATLAFSAIRIVRRRASPFAARVSAVVFLLACLLPVSEIRSFFLMEAGEASWLAVIVPLLYLPEGVLLTSCYALLRRKDWRGAQATAALLLILSPLPFISVASVVWRWPFGRDIAGTADFSSSPGSPPAERRLIWVILDEWDRGVALDHRPRGFDLPEHDRLREVSTEIRDAYSPGDETSEVIPSLLTGQVVEGTQPAGPSEFRIRYRATSDVHRLSDTPNLFQALSSRGVRNAVAGWFHPYCRVFGTWLSACHWQQYPMPLEKTSINEIQARQNGMTAFMATQLAERVADIPWLRPLDYQHRALYPQYREALRRETIQLTVAHEQKALELVADETLGFVVLHFPIPHPPGIADPASGEYRTSDEGDYFGNLLLVDRVLGRIRTTLEQTNAWHRTAIVVTSDHPLRYESWKRLCLWSARETQRLEGITSSRVPLFIRMPGQATSQTYPREWNTVHLYSFTLAFFEGRLNSEYDVLRYLDNQLQEPAPPVARVAR
jgi:hypothetical protein